MRPGGATAHCGPTQSVPISIGSMSSRAAASQSCSAISRKRSFETPGTDCTTERTAFMSVPCSYSARTRTLGHSGIAPGPGSS